MPAPTMNARVTMTATVMGEVQLQRALQGRIAATSDLSPAFAQIADNFVEGEEQVFAREGKVRSRSEALAALAAGKPPVTLEAIAADVEELKARPASEPIQEPL